MILSASGIKAHIIKGDISIFPFDEQNLKPSNYTFTLGDKMRRPIGPEIIDSMAEDQEYEEVVIRESGYELQSGEFILAETAEHIILGLTIACLLETRPAIARMGIDAVQSSTLAEPRTDNPFTLEISNRGKYPVKLYPGLKIVKGVFIRLSDS